MFLSRDTSGRPSRLAALPGAGEGGRSVFKGRGARSDGRRWETEGVGTYLAAATAKPLPCGDGDRKMQRPSNPGRPHRGMGMDILAPSQRRRAAKSGPLYRGKIKSCMRCGWRRQCPAAPRPGVRFGIGGDGHRQVGPEPDPALVRRLEIGRLPLWPSGPSSRPLCRWADGKPAGRSPGPSPRTSRCTLCGAYTALGLGAARCGGWPCLRRGQGRSGKRGKGGPSDGGSPL